MDASLLQDMQWRHLNNKQALLAPAWHWQYTFLYQLARCPGGSTASNGDCV